MAAWLSRKDSDKMKLIIDMVKERVSGYIRLVIQATPTKYIRWLFVFFMQVGVK